MRVLRTIAVVFAVVLGVSPALGSTGFTVTRLTTDSERKYHPRTNSNGDVTWLGQAVSDYQDLDIFLRRTDGVTTELVVPGYHANSYPTINSSGDVVWSATATDGSRADVFLYEAATGAIRRLTDDSYTPSYWGWPEISDNGQVVWSGWNGTGFTVFLRRVDGTVTRLTESGSWDPRINARGDVTWDGPVPEGSWRDVFLYEAATGAVRRLTTGPYSASHEEINARGDIVWEGWRDTGSEIFLYDSSSRAVIQVTNNQCDDYEPLIGDGGDIIWTGSTDANCYEYDAYLRKSDGTIKRLTHNPYPGYGYWDKDINVNGDAVFVMWGTPAPYGTELYAYLSRSDTVVKVDDTTGPEWPQITDVGDIVWQGMDQSTNTVQVYRARLLDGDGDGVPDGLDACPAQNALGFDADHDGCLDSVSGLAQIIATLPDGVLSDETRTSLAAKVDQAERSQDRSAIDAAIQQLTAFVNEVKAQAGNKVSTDAAAELTAYANNVISQLGG